MCIVAPGLIIALIALFINGSDYFLGGMVGLITAPVMYIIFRRKYGGMTVENPEKYPYEPEDKTG